MKLLCSRPNEGNPDIIFKIHFIINPPIRAQVFLADFFPFRFSYQIFTCVSHRTHVSHVLLTSYVIKSY
jgi:hypothetical protein